MRRLTTLEYRVPAARLVVVDHQTECQTLTPALELIAVGALDHLGSAISKQPIAGSKQVSR